MNLSAKNIRKNILRISHAKKSPHVGSALSCVEILLAAYSVKINLRNSGNNNCKVVFSKGHAALAVYSTLTELNLLPAEVLETYNQNNSHLYGHLSHRASPQIELTTGSLGHGLPFALGLALASQIKKEQSAPIIAILSDGECDEGTTWESALIANQFNLSNLFVIIDRNKLQSLTSTEDTLKLEPFADKWRAFGWEVFEVDGHDQIQISALLEESSRPRCIIANTKKGSGVSFMENSVIWHYKSPNDSELLEALEEIERNS